METPDTTLNVMERYTVWCEKIRDLFSGITHPLFNNEIDEQSEEDRVSLASEYGDGVSGVVDRGEQKYQECDGMFPYCFYMRMLGSGEKGHKVIAHEMNAADCSDNNVSFLVSPRKEEPLHIDSDALAARLASQLNAYARKLQRKQSKETIFAVNSDGIHWPFRDGRVEALAAEVNGELHQLLMYVRRQNLLAETLRRQLVQTKLLLLSQRGTTA